MSKKQKLWFALFLAMFLIPEILWGGVNTLICGAIFRGDGLNSLALLPAIQSNGLNKLVICVEFTGLFFATFFSFLFYHPRNIFLKIIVTIILLFLLLLAFYLLLFSFNFNPQIG